MYRKLIVALALASAIVATGCASRMRTGDTCFYRGSGYPSGAVACQSGEEYACNDGRWQATRTICRGDSLAFSGSCEYGGFSFAGGDTSCQSGTQYRCDQGIWRSMGMRCAAGDAPYYYRPARHFERDCFYGNSAMPAEATICDVGTTYVCRDGGWVNLGRPCR